MTILCCYVDDRTFRILEKESRISGRKIEELAEAAISDAALRSDIAASIFPPKPEPGELK